MTSKEALKFIIKTFNKLAQKPQDIGLFFQFCEAHEKVQQDLDRLEELEKENQELREIIKANFFYHEYSEEIGYRVPIPKYQEKIKEVLKDAN